MGFGGGTVFEAWAYCVALSSGWRLKPPFYFHTLCLVFFNSASVGREGQDVGRQHSAFGGVSCRHWPFLGWGGDVLAPGGCPGPWGLLASPVAFIRPSQGCSWEASGSRTLSLCFLCSCSFSTLLVSGSLFKITFIELSASALCVSYFSPARDTEWMHPRLTKLRSCHLLKLMVGMKIIAEFVFGRQLDNIAQEL